MRGKNKSQTLPHQTSHDRPPAPLPESDEISDQEDQNQEDQNQEDQDQEDNQDYATICSPLTSDKKLPTNLVYDSVRPKPNTIPRLKDANAVLTGPTQRKDLFLAM